ncbi:MAG: hypothetical protein HQM16_14060 [Deltaproteobacteria bacterium]|nr:hypothetical protein [Deltaproteobacteria bacterium]
MSEDYTTIQKPDGEGASQAKAATEVGAVGVDIGTSRIVGIKKGPSDTFDSKIEYNGFFTVPFSDMAKNTIEKNGMNYRKSGDYLAVLGSGAQEFAAFSSGEMHRPMQNGLLTSQEEQALPMIKDIIKLVVDKPKKFGDKLCFSVPAAAPGYESDLVFHAAVFRQFFAGLGYNTKALNEGTAVVLSELAEENYTGIGISMGAGMCNVCFSFLSVPVITYSVPKGGDYIDQSVSRIVSESMNKVRVIKEGELDFTKPPKNRMEQAFHVFYEDLIESVLKTLTGIFAKTPAGNMPKFQKAIPVVLAGGTCMPNGFAAKFDTVLKKVSLPIEISEVRTAKDPLRATAKGCLVYAAS